MKRFHNSIRRPGGMTKRQTVLSLMRIAGYENDSAKFTRLLIENPISRRVAEDAWHEGRTKRDSERPLVTIEPIEPTPPFTQRYTIRVHEETDEAWIGVHVYGNSQPSTFPKFAWKLVEVSR